MPRLGSSFGWIALGLSLTACVDGEAAAGRVCPTSLCEASVPVVLGDVGADYADDLPLAMRVCFDKRCDDVDLVPRARGAALECAYRSGFAPARRLDCAASGGRVWVDAASLVDRSASLDGGEHVVAVSLVGRSGQLRFARAQRVRLERPLDEAPCEVRCPSQQRLDWSR